MSNSFENCHNMIGKASRSIISVVPFNKVIGLIVDEVVGDQILSCVKQLQEVIETGQYLDDIGLLYYNAAPMNDLALGAL